MIETIINFEEPIFTNHERGIIYRYIKAANTRDAKVVRQHKKRGPSTTRCWREKFEVRPLSPAKYFYNNNQK